MIKRVVVATVTMFFQQWTGINAVLYYVSGHLQIPLAMRRAHRITPPFHQFLIVYNNYQRHKSDP